MTSQDIIALLKLRFPFEKGWAVVTEWSPPTTTHRFDAVILNVWANATREVHGVEIKVSKEDWRKEQEHPTKLPALQEHCDRVWLAAPKGVISKGALPKGIGLLECTDKQAKAAVRPDAISRKPWSPQVWSHLMGRYTREFTPKHAIDQARREGYAAATEHARQQRERHTGGSNDDREIIQRFQRLTGFVLTKYTPEADITRFGVLARELQEGEAGRHLSRLHSILNQVDGISNMIRTTVENVEKAYG